MAYDPGQLVQGICVHSIGRQQAGPLLAFRNLLAVWFLTGFWHGASWNFIIWGLLLFFILSVERLGLIRILERWRMAGHLYMAFMIPLTWLVFFCSHGHKTNYSVFPKAVPGLCTAATILLFQRRLCEVCKTVCSFPGSGVIVHDRHSLRI